MSLANDGCLIAMVVIQSQVRLVVILLNTCGCNLWLCHLGHFLRTHYPQTCHVGKIRGYIFFTDMGHEVCYRGSGWKGECGAPVPI